jgi:hypothetical protein
MVETVGIHEEMWFVMHESTTDQVLGVDTPGQQVPPRVSYVMTSLLIRAAIGCESCSVVWGKTQNMISSTRCKSGSRYEETLALEVGTQGQGKP